MISADKTQSGTDGPVEVLDLGSNPQIGSLLSNKRISSILGSAHRRYWKRSRRLTREIAPAQGPIARFDENRTELRPIDTVETAVLVDGCPVSAGLLDLVVTAAEAMDPEKSAADFTVTLPGPSSPERAGLWTDLTRFVEGRFGAERGAFEVSYSAV